MTEDIKVSVCCNVYNHEKFLTRCLESLVSQKTDFLFEILINDDCSTDKSVEIIKQFQEKYPQIIKPLYQEHNLYSKGIAINNEVLIPLAKGKYIAFCEGDDYWCDDRKLQIQYEFMEKNQNCSMCITNTIKHNLSNNKETLFNNWKNIHKLNEEEIFMGWYVHTSSYFLRKEYAIPPVELYKKYWFGDYIKLTLAYYYGDVYCLPNVTSVYNYNNPNGMTVTIYKKNNNSKKIDKLELIKDYLNQYNKYTNFKFENIVNEKIGIMDLTIKKIKYYEVNSYKDFKIWKSSLKESKYYKSFLNRLSLKEKIKFYLRYCYPIFLIIKKIKLRENNNE